jgi:glycerophosphoryl diester phosphodiesterase
MKIYAHRGFSGKFPEGTRVAYEAAIKSKVDGLECDIRLTRDLVPVCFHDRNLKRIANNSKSVSNLSLLEMRALTELITLHELIEIARNSQVELLIETKHPSRFGREVERKVLNEIKDIGNTTVISFSWFAVRWLRQRTKRVGFVVANRWRLLFIPTEIVAIDFELFNRSAWVRKRLAGKKVLLWTVNNVSDIKFRAQISGVITDRPDLPFRLS